MKTAELGYFGNIWVKQNDPESASARDDGYWEKVKEIDK